MSEKKNSDEPARDKIAEMRDRKLAPARTELAKLDNDELAQLLYEELDRRRLTPEGNRTDPPGLYQAATTAVAALLGQVRSKAEIDRIEGHLGAGAVPPTARDDAALAERLAAVGRGISLGPEKPAALVREIAELVEAMERSTNFAETDKPAVLARTLAERFACEVSDQQVAGALRERSRYKRIAFVALAAGVETDEEHTKQAMKALR